MDRNLSCPECGHKEIHCSATITATLKTNQLEDGSWDYQLSEWEDIENIESYDCQNCGFGFIGNEEEFLKNRLTVNDSAS